MRLRRLLPGQLLDAQDDELGRLERREANDDVDDAPVAVELGRRLPVALDQIGIARRLPLELSLIHI